MVEYGNGVAHGAGQVPGGHTTGGGSIDVGSGVGHFIDNAVHTVSTMPPEQLVLLVVAVFVGLLILRRAF